MSFKKNMFVFLAIFCSATISKALDLQETEVIAAIGLKYFVVEGSKKGGVVDVSGIRFYVPAVIGVPENVDQFGERREAYARLLFRTEIYNLEDSGDVPVSKQEQALAQFKEKAKKAVLQEGALRDKDVPLSLERVDDQTYCRYKFNKKENKPCIECISYFTPEQFRDFWKKVGMSGKSFGF